MDVFIYIGSNQGDKTSEPTFSHFRKVINPEKYLGFAENEDIVVLKHNGKPFFGRIARIVGDPDIGKGFFCLVNQNEFDDLISTNQWTLTEAP